MDTNKQKEILNDFILEFLPKRGNERKYPTNEIDYVTQAVRWVCMKYFFFRPTDEEVISSLKTLGYRFLKKKDDNWLKGRIKGGKKILSEFIYVDVSPVIVKDLKMSTRTLPPNTSKERNKEISDLRERIEAFKREHVIR